MPATVKSVKTMVKVRSFLKISSVISQWFNLPLPLSPVFGFLIFHLPVPINTLSWLTKLKICSSKVAVTDFEPSNVISISLDVSEVDPDHVVKSDPEFGFAFNLITVPALYSSFFRWTYNSLTNLSWTNQPNI